MELACVARVTSWSSMHIRKLGQTFDCASVLIRSAREKSAAGTGLGNRWSPPLNVWLYLWRWAKRTARGSYCVRRRCCLPSPACRRCWLCCSRRGPSCAATPTAAAWPAPCAAWAATKILRPTTPTTIWSSSSIPKSLSRWFFSSICFALFSYLVLSFFSCWCSRSSFVSLVLACLS